jgi:hypothetical protein
VWFLDANYTYGAAICGVDIVDEIVSEVVLVWCPRVNGMPILFQGRDDLLNAPEDGWMGKNLVKWSEQYNMSGVGTYDAIARVIS